MPPDRAEARPVTLHSLGHSGAGMQTLETLAQELPGRWAWGRHRREWLARSAMLRQLQSDGFDRYAQRTEHLAELCAQAVRACLHKAELAPGAVDAVLFATESFWDHDIARYEGQIDTHIRLRHALLELLAQPGLGDVALYGNWLSACANLGTTLSVAKALVESGQHHSVLIILGDRHPPHVPRLMRNGSSVLSDLAVAFLVDASSARGLEVGTVVSLSSHRLAAVAFAVEQHPVLYVQETRRCLRRLGEQFRERAGFALHEADHVVVESFHPKAFALMADELGIDPARLRRDARSAFGHAGAADPLLTLEAMSGQGLLHQGQSVVMINSVAWAWSATELRAA